MNANGVSRRASIESDLSDETSSMKRPGFIGKYLPVICSSFFGVLVGVFAYNNTRALYADNYHNHYDDDMKLATKNFFKNFLKAPGGDAASFAKKMEFTDFIQMSIGISTGILSAASVFFANMRLDHTHKNYNNRFMAAKLVSLLSSCLVLISSITIYLTHFGKDNGREYGYLYQFAYLCGQYNNFTQPNSTCINEEVTSRGNVTDPYMADTPPEDRLNQVSSNWLPAVVPLMLLGGLIFAIICDRYLREVHHVNELPVDMPAEALAPAVGQLDTIEEEHYFELSDESALVQAPPEGRKSCWQAMQAVLFSQTVRDRSNSNRSGDISLPGIDCT